MLVSARRLPGHVNALQRRDAGGLAHILRTHLRRKREEVVQAGFAEANDR
jgi:hypothetical protein